MYIVKSQTENIDCKLTRTAENYSGSMSKSNKGIKCQNWNELVPHFHTTKLENTSDYCRNPSQFKDGVWCFTVFVNVRWQYCNVGYCEESDCNRGVSFNTPLNTDINGTLCLFWNSVPYRHMPWNFPKSSIDLSRNYCRNPSYSDEGPWCYVNISNSINEKPCFIEYCHINFTKSCKGNSNIQGQVSIVYHDGEKCDEVCYLSVNYDDSQPERQIANNPIQVMGAKSYKDVLYDFYLSPDDFVNETFYFSIKDIRYKYFLCLNESHLYLSTTKCIFKAECVNRTVPQIFNVSRLDHTCFIQLNHGCQLVYLIKNPMGYKIVPENHSLITINNSKLFFISIVRIYNNLKKLVIIPIREVISSAKSCVSMIMGTYYMRAALNINISCNCKLLSHLILHVKIGENWMQFVRKYDFSYSYTDKFCNITPEFTPITLPYFLKEDEVFPIKFPEYGLSVMIVDRDLKDCIYDKDYKESLIVFNNTNCCIPLCYIQIKIELHRYDGIIVLGTYIIINIYNKTLKFSPDLIYLLFRPRKLNCYFYRLASTLQKNLKKVLYYIDDNETETEIPFYHLHTFVSKVRLKCKCFVTSINISKLLLLEQIQHTYLLVEIFAAHIEWNGQLRIGETINCTTNNSAPPGSIILDWQVDHQIPLKEHISTQTEYPELNKISLQFNKNSPIGDLSMLCTAAIDDIYVDEVISYTYHSYDWIQVYLKGLLYESISPSHTILRANETLSCQSPESTISKMSVKSDNTKAMFQSDTSSFVVKDYIRSGIYTVHCNYVGHLNTIYEMKIIFNRELFVIPDLPFYILNKRGVIQCIIDPDVFFPFFSIEITMESTNASNKRILIFQNRFLYFSHSDPGTYFIICSLFAKLKIMKNFTNSTVYPYVTREILLSKYEKKVMLIPPFILFINQTLYHLMNQTVVCKSDSEYLMTNLEIFVVKWIITPLTPYKSTYNELLFPLTTPPNTYYIKCIYTYDIFNNFTHGFTQYFETTIDLTAILEFSIKPNHSILRSGDESCCIVKSLVAFNLQMIFNDSSFNGNGSICQTTPDKFKSKLNLIACRIFYNNRYFFKNQTLLFIQNPEKLFFKPKSPMLDTYITCFPYSEIFSIKAFPLVTISINLTIINLPINDIIKVIISDNNLTLYESENGRLLLNEFFNSFGNYTFDCQAKVTIFNDTFYFEKEEVVEIAAFSHKNIDTTLYSQTISLFDFWIIALLYMILFPGVIFTIHFNKINHARHKRVIKKTLNTIGYSARKIFTKQKKIEWFYFESDVADCFETVFTIIFVYNHLTKKRILSQIYQRDMAEYNIDSPALNISSVLNTVKFSDISSHESKDETLNRLRQINARPKLYLEKLMNKQRSEDHEKATVSHFLNEVLNVPRRLRQINPRPKSYLEKLMNKQRSEDHEKATVSYFLNEVLNVPRVIPGTRIEWHPEQTRMLSRRNKQTPLRLLAARQLLLEHFNDESRSLFMKEKLNDRQIFLENFNEKTRSHLSKEKLTDVKILVSTADLKSSLKQPQPQIIHITKKINPIPFIEKTSTENIRSNIDTSELLKTVESELRSQTKFKKMEVETKYTFPLKLNIMSQKIKSLLPDKMGREIIKYDSTGTENDSSETEPLTLMEKYAYIKDIVNQRYTVATIKNMDNL